MKWFFLLPIWFAFNILAILLAPILALFPVMRVGPINNNDSIGNEPRLPLWLSWFDTYDNSLLGDYAWKSMEADHWDWRANFARYPSLQAYLGRLGWLWRNPAYGFERSVLAAKINPFDTVTFTGDPFIQDGNKGKEGTCFVRIGSYWSWVLIKRITTNRCIKLVFGWKLKTYAEDTSRLGKEPIAQYVFSPKLSKFVER